MKVWAIGDLHLSFGVPEKTMEIFGPQWADYSNRIKANWLESIEPKDLVLIPGDISWAISQDVARIDLEWIDQLPGIKVLIKGNHDYWWGSLSKLQVILPPSVHLIQNNVFNYEGISVGGARLWDSEEYHFNDFIHFKENPKASKEQDKFEARKIFKRELERFELSLKQLDQNARMRIAMTHYPPISADLHPSKASALLEKYNVDICVFGHLHNVKKTGQLFGLSGKTSYFLTSSDFLEFKPLLISG